MFHQAVVQVVERGLPTVVWSAMIYHIVIILCASCSHCGTTKADCLDHDLWQQIAYGFVFRDPTRFCYRIPAKKNSTTRQLTTQFWAVRSSCRECNKGGSNKEKGGGAGWPYDVHGKIKKFSTRSAGLRGGDWLFRLDEMPNAHLQKFGCYEGATQTDDGPTQDDEVCKFYSQMNFEMHKSLSWEYRDRTPSVSREKALPQRAILPGGPWVVN